MPIYVGDNYYQYNQCIPHYYDLLSSESKIRAMRFALEDQHLHGDREYKFIYVGKLEP